MFFSALLCTVSMNLDQPGLLGPFRVSQVWWVRSGSAGFVGSVPGQLGPFRVCWVRFGSVLGPAGSAAKALLQSIYIYIYGHIYIYTDTHRHAHNTHNTHTHNTQTLQHPSHNLQYLKYSALQSSMFETHTDTHTHTNTIKSHTHSTHNTHTHTQHTHTRKHTDTPIFGSKKSIRML